jgi:hypothetical protein
MELHSAGHPAVSAGSLVATRFDRWADSIAVPTTSNASEEEREGGTNPDDSGFCAFVDAVDWLVFGRGKRLRADH